MSTDEIDKIRTSPYWTACKGTLDRFNATLSSMLSKVVADNQGDCDINISFVMANYVTPWHDATDYSPNYFVLE